MPPPEQVQTSGYSNRYQIKRKYREKKMPEHSVRNTGGGLGIIKLFGVFSSPLRRDPGVCTAESYKISSADPV
jgi:hypothetical protein